MASLDGGFNSAEVEPVSFDVVPAGEYRACIVGSERKMTKAGDGEILKLTLQILDGPSKNRKIFENINWVNKSAKAQQIGRGTLSSICRATGVLTLTDTTQLHNLPMRIKVTVRQEDGRNPENDVKDYKPDGATAPTAPAGQVQQPQQQPAQTAPAGPQGVWGNA